MSNWFPVEKEGANTTYADKSECELAENHTCYEITGKDLRYHEVLDGELVENAQLKIDIAAQDVIAESNANALNLKAILQNYVVDGEHVLQADIDALIAKLELYIER